MPYSWYSALAVGTRVLLPLPLGDVGRRPTGPASSTAEGAEPCFLERELTLAGEPWIVDSTEVFLAADLRGKLRQHHQTKSRVLLTPLVIWYDLACGASLHDYAQISSPSRALW